MWVAVGQCSTGSSSQNTIASSPDGNTWTGYGSYVFTTTGYGVVYGNGMWVAAGQGGNTIASSPNGTTWTGRGRTILSGDGGGGVAYGNGRFVVAGSGGNTIATSTDGINWAGQNNTFTSYCTAITYGNGKFVICGAGGNVIATSSDGLSWSGQTTTNINFGRGQGLSYGNGLFVVVSDGTTSNTIATSPDGITWTGRGIQFFADTRGYGIAYGKDDAGNPLWVALGSPGSPSPANTIVTSSDGITWIGRGGSIFSTDARGAAYNTSLG
jgi:hypothetical protein